MNRQALKSAFQLAVRLEELEKLKLFIENDMLKPLGTVEAENNCHGFEICFCAGRKKIAVTTLPVMLTLTAVANASLEKEIADIKGVLKENYGVEE